MSNKKQRVQEKSFYDTIREFIEKYAYLETTILVALYVGTGYTINYNDPCMLTYNIPYLVMLLAVITLFHGFENGIFAVSIISFIMWIAYPAFHYVDFLVALLMTLVFSQFHYYWTSRINEAEVNANFKSDKLAELSRAFYTLKISHDQLEKNYVIKPMSIRNSINKIINTNEEIFLDDSIEDKMYAYNRNFLTLLEKSFNLQSGFIIYPQDPDTKIFTKKNIKIVTLNMKESIDQDKILDNYLIDKALAKHSPIYISDEVGEPSTALNESENKFIAVIPSILNNKVASLLVIEKMPFMFFNRENLTSITILHDYFTIENRKTELAFSLKGFDLLSDKDFKFELTRLQTLNQKFKVNSVTLILRIDNELQTARVYQKVERMLRSLDMITLVQNGKYYYIIVLLPLHDQAAALGLLRRLESLLEEEQDQTFNYMTFDMDQLTLLSKYIREDYDR